MKINEVSGGTFGGSSDPDFSNSQSAGVINGYEIVIGTWNGYTIVGILSDSGDALSHMILRHLQNMEFELEEIHTVPAYRGKGMVASLSTEDLHTQVFTAHINDQPMFGEDFILKPRMYIRNVEHEEYD